MAKYGITRRRFALIALPAALVLAGGAGVAVAATGHGSGDGNDHPSYHSSITTQSAADSGNEAAADRTLATLVKVSVADAARAAAQSVSGGSVISIELGNEGGNVVYAAGVVDSHGAYEVVIDAGNGHVLAKQADHDNEKADGGVRAGTSGASSQR